MLAELAQDKPPDDSPDQSDGLNPPHDDLSDAGGNGIGGVDHLGFQMEPGQGALIIAQVVKAPLASTDALRLGIGLGTFNQRVLVRVPPT